MMKRRKRRNTINEIDEYRVLGVSGIHLYVLNKWKTVSESMQSPDRIPCLKFKFRRRLIYGTCNCSRGKRRRR